MIIIAGYGTEPKGAASDQSYSGDRGAALTLVRLE